MCDCTRRRISTYTQLHHRSSPDDRRACSLPAIHHCHRLAHRWGEGADGRCSRCHCREAATRPPPLGGRDQGAHSPGRPGSPARGLGYPATTATKKFPTDHSSRSCHLDLVPRREESGMEEETPSSAYPQTREARSPSSQPVNSVQ